MPDFMVLLYATEPDEAELRERWAELPEWDLGRAAGVG